MFCASMTTVIIGVAPGDAMRGFGRRVSEARLLGFVFVEGSSSAKECCFTGRLVKLKSSIAKSTMSSGNATRRMPCFFDMTFILLSEEMRDLSLLRHCLVLCLVLQARQRLYLCQRQ